MMLASVNQSVIVSPDKRDVICWMRCDASIIVNNGTQAR